MSYCDHCDGQRFDRARVLRELRQIRREMLRDGRGAACEALDLALQRVRSLDIPHLEWEEDLEDQIVH
jgi:hypothetical protein